MVLANLLDRLLADVPKRGRQIALVRALAGTGVDVGPVTVHRWFRGLRFPQRAETSALVSLYAQDDPTRTGLLWRLAGGDEVPDVEVEQAFGLKPVDHFDGDDTSPPEPADPPLPIPTATVAA